jgi:chorismate mutase
LPKATSETDYDHFLFPNNININEKIKDIYINEIIHKLSKDKQDDDYHYGNSATCDIEALQAISKRIHFGKERKKKREVMYKNSFFFLSF